MDNIEMKNEQKVLVIGNGFDIYHHLPTRYIDFLKVVERLKELEGKGKLQNCQFVNYILGQDSKIYKEDEYIQTCYKFHSDRMKSVKLNENAIMTLVELTKNNIWIDYFINKLIKDIKWIDFEKEIGRVLEAVESLFELETKTKILVTGIDFDSIINEIGIKNYDILVNLKLIIRKNDSDLFIIEPNCVLKDFDETLFVEINKTKIFDKLEEDMQSLAQALCIYLREFVHKIVINKKTENPVFACVDKVLSFNYTDTYRKLYDNEQKVDIKFIHGNLDDGNGIVLGINDDNRDELEYMDAQLIRFRKYYQRALKETFYSVSDFLSDDVKYKVSIVGHSIDKTDRDILVELIGHPRTTTTIYYHNDQAHQQQIINLITLVGKRKFAEWYNSNKVCFKYLDYWKCL